MTIIFNCSSSIKYLPYTEIQKFKYLFIYPPSFLLISSEDSSQNPKFEFSTAYEGEEG